MISQLAQNVFFQSVGAVVIFGIGSIVRPTIGKHSFQVSDEESFVTVVVGFQPFRHRFQIHRIFDMIVIIGNLKNTGN